MFFAAVNRLIGPRETDIHFNWVKRSRLLIVIGRFRSILFVSVFHGSLAVAIIMIDGRESSHFTENRFTPSREIEKGLSNLRMVGLSYRG